jgi:predicted enzyme related to lactoylglutathione lyase
MDNRDNHINYIEFKAKDLEKIKEFYIASFDWTFIYYGTTYTSFSNRVLEGWFEKEDSATVNGALVVL